MTKDDLLTYPLSNGTPTNNTDPIGGTLDDSGGTWSEGSDTLIADVEVEDSGGSDLVYYGAATKAIASSATGTLSGPKIVNRAASILNSSSGVASIVSTSSNDDGEVRGTGKVSGVWAPEDIACAGTSPSSGSNVWDANDAWCWEYLVDGAAARPQGNITISIAGETVAVIYGTGNPPSVDAGNGDYQANALFDVAVATDINTEITWSSTNNRLTAPDGEVGSFSRANKWTGDDSSIAVASNMVADDEIQYCVRMTAPAGLPEAVLGSWACDIGLIGSAT